MQKLLLTLLAGLTCLLAIPQLNWQPETDFSHANQAKSAPLAFINAHNQAQTDSAAQTDRALRRFKLERLSINQDANLNELQKAQAIDRLHQQLPKDIKPLIDTQLKAELELATQTLLSQQASTEDIRSLRWRSIGFSGSQRLEEQALQRQHWQQRLSHYQAERNKIEQNQKLSAGDKYHAIKRIERQQFSAKERLLLESHLGAGPAEALTR